MNITPIRLRALELLATRACSVRCLMVGRSNPLPALTRAGFAVYDPAALGHRITDKGRIALALARRCAPRGTP